METGLSAEPYDRSMGLTPRDTAPRGMINDAMCAGLQANDKSRRYFMGMSVRIGILGCGGIARTAHLRSLARIPGAEVVALADADPANLAAARSLAPAAR